MTRRIGGDLWRALPATLLVAVLARTAQSAVDIDMIIASSGNGGGALVLRHDTSLPVLVTPSLSSDGTTRYTTTQPGFEALLRPEGGLFPLKDGTPVRMEITTVDPTVSFKMGAASLDVVGEAAPIGQMPNLHVHGEWRLLLPDGVIGAYRLAFKLTTTARGYTDSAVYAFTVTNSPSGGGGGSTTTTTLPVPAPAHLSGAALTVRPATLAVRSRDAAVSLGGGSGSSDDPTLVGAELRVVVAQAGLGFELPFDLPAAGWKPLGNPSRSKGYRYRDRGRRFGPITKVTIRRGRGIVIAGKGVSLGTALTTEPDSVSVVLGLGSQRYCMRFGGTTRFRPARRFDARNAPPPSACTEIP
jgi:hypothetical protein